MDDKEFDAMHGGRELLPIEQLVYEAEGAARFQRCHGHGRIFPRQVEHNPAIGAALPSTATESQP